eukprot:2129900-Prymnesium_polylepis.1
MEPLQAKVAEETFKQLEQDIYDTDAQLTAAERDALTAIDTNAAIESAILEAGKNGGGGVRLPPPSLLVPRDGLEPDDAALESLAALETAPLPAGKAGGGGVRLPPPRLLGTEPESAEEEAMEAVLAMSAQPLEPNEPVPAAHKPAPVSRDLLQASTEPEAVPPDEMPPALDVATLSSSGGGVRLPPPRLMAAGDGLDADEAALESLAALETAPLPAGAAGGGG